MGSSLSISVPGLKPEEATNCLVASAMDKGYEVEKIHSDDLKFRIQPINESDPTPTHEVLIIKGHGVFNINHTQRRIGQLPVVHKVESNEQKVEQKSEQMDDVDQMMKRLKMRRLRRLRKLKIFALLYTLHPLNDIVPRVISHVCSFLHTPFYLNLKIYNV